MSQQKFMEELNHVVEGPLYSAASAKLHVLHKKQLDDQQVVEAYLEHLQTSHDEVSSAHFRVMAQEASLASIAESLWALRSDKQSLTRTATEASEAKESMAGSAAPTEQSRPKLSSLITEYFDRARNSMKKLVQAARSQMEHDQPSLPFNKELNAIYERDYAAAEQDIKAADLAAEAARSACLEASLYVQGLEHSLPTLGIASMNDYSPLEAGRHSETPYRFALEASVMTTSVVPLLLLAGRTESSAALATSTGPLHTDVRSLRSRKQDTEQTQVNILDWIEEPSSQEQVNARHTTLRFWRLH